MAGAMRKPGVSSAVALARDLPDVHVELHGHGVDGGPVAFVEYVPQAPLDDVAVATHRAPSSGRT